MAKRRRKRGKKSSKVNVKPKFKQAMFKIRRMSKQGQRKIVAQASPQFVKDVGIFLSKIRNRPHLIKNAKHRRQLKRHGTKLRRLVNPHVSVEKKRRILLMKGGIIPFLVPIICASIGAAGTVGAAATSAAIMKS